MGNNSCSAHDRLSPDFQSHCYFPTLNVAQTKHIKASKTYHSKISRRNISYLIGHEKLSVASVSQSLINRYLYISWKIVLLLLLISSSQINLSSLSACFLAYIGIKNNRNDSEKELLAPLWVVFYLTAVVRIITWHHQVCFEYVNKYSR